MSEPVIDPLARLERWSQMLWTRIYSASVDWMDPLAHERERLHLSEALSQLHGARMVLDGEALEAAELLYFLVWQRILDHGLRLTQTDMDTTAQQEAA